MVASKVSTEREKRESGKRKIQVSRQGKGLQVNRRRMVKRTKSEEREGKPRKLRWVRKDKGGKDKKDEKWKMESYRMREYCVRKRNSITAKKEKWKEELSPLEMTAGGGEKRFGDKKENV